MAKIKKFITNIEVEFLVDAVPYISHIDTSRLSQSTQLVVQCIQSII